MRTINIPSQTVTESIQSVNYYVGVYVDVMIGIGSVVDGVFQFSIPQQFDNVKIVNAPATINPETEEIVAPAITDFSDLESKYPNGNFSTDDLWPYIDLVRSRR
jgi:hypothetical protein